MKGDLHVHTTISDGSYTTEEVLNIAKGNHITHIAITNHDTTKGLEEACKLGEKLGIKVIPGIEISAYDFSTKRKVHILGYNFNLKGKNIRELCKDTLIKRDENSRYQIKTLVENGYKVSLKYIEEKSKDSEAIYKQHIMTSLIKSGYTNEIYGSLYKELFKGKGICARDIDYVDVIEAIQAIKKDGGIAVLAHPGQQKVFDIIPELISSGLDGIELNHISNSETDREKIKEISNKYGLILTGGSDFHGEYGEKHMTIGDELCPEELLKLL